MSCKPNCKAVIATMLMVGITCTHGVGIVTNPDNKVISKHYGPITACFMHHIAITSNTITDNLLTPFKNGSTYSEEPLYFTFTFNFHIKSTKATVNHYFGLFVVSRWGYPRVVHSVANLVKLI